MLVVRALWWASMALLRSLPWPLLLNTLRNESEESLGHYLAISASLRRSRGASVEEARFEAGNRSHFVFGRERRFKSPTKPRPTHYGAIRHRAAKKQATPYAHMTTTT